MKEKVGYLHIQLGPGNTVRPGGVSSDLSLQNGIDFNYLYHSVSEHSDEKKDATVEKTSEEGTHSSAGKKGSMDVPKLVDPDGFTDSDRSIENREQESTRLPENVAFFEPLLGDEVNVNPKDQQAMEVEESVEVHDVLEEDVRPREVEVVQKNQLDSVSKEARKN
ncbi:unnamed protein product [Haemonchus placei]|uniref:Ovule protein n=1 Tax=Haemonchus placei TaxID=6290 RepID=A0A0N4WM62_HAEPC|nr:unnamed protein product [Haemonchus placei]